VLRIKLLSSGKSLTPYIARVVTGGRVQKAFAAQIGIPTGACVRGKVHKGMAQSDIRKAVKECAPAKGSVHLNLAR
jgi:hypothetical protein